MSTYRNYKQVMSQHTPLLVVLFFLSLGTQAGISRSEAVTSLAQKMDTPASTAETSPKNAFPKIAVVQIEHVLGEFRGKLKDQFSKYLDKYYQEFSAHEEKLREEHRRLLDQQKNIKKEDKKANETWAEKMREFETRVMDIQKIGEEKRHKLEQQYNQIIEKIYQELRGILKDLAHEKDIKLFIKDQHALHWDESLNVTDIVYKRLKERIAEQDLIIKDSVNG